MLMLKQISTKCKNTAYSQYIPTVSPVSTPSHPLLLIMCPIPAAGSYQLQLHKPRHSKAPTPTCHSTQVESMTWHISTSDISQQDTEVSTTKESAVSFLDCQCSHVTLTIYTSSIAAAHEVYLSIRCTLMARPCTGRNKTVTKNRGRNTYNHTCKCSCSAVPACQLCAAVSHAADIPTQPFPCACSMLPMPELTAWPLAPAEKSHGIRMQTHAHMLSCSLSAAHLIQYSI